MTCKYCGTRGKQKSKKIVKGFCPQHYRWYRFGYIDFEGKPLKKLPKVFLKDKTNLKCKVTTCQKQAETGEYCETHYSSYLQGYLNEEGTARRSPNFSREGVCVVEGCKEKRHQRGRCVKHYKEYLNSYEDTDRRKHAYVNQGICPIVGCDKKKWSAGLCRTHYKHYQKGKFDNDYQPQEYIGPTLKNIELVSRYCLRCNTHFATNNKYRRLCDNCNGLSRSMI